ncbi:hypothetical protein [Glycomyces harbinensis]|uniref:Uncharacterized protein n=1 Tax=Glycomyces harbinensis TaxID=58114 RepID=A0A1G6VRV5_9ACTN|nr:hypothetical protein [Glycomyces harbinensis]SDD55576.1 hypothetical protein SAMN05216270_10566 [Glycomyces harbinensis]
MSDQNTPYAAGEQETFGFIDDEEENEESLEDDILNAEGYREAAAFGMTPEEERRGPSLDEELAAEEPDVADEPGGPGPGDPIPDEPSEPQDPDSGEPLPDEPAPPRIRP